MHMHGCFYLCMWMPHSVDPLQLPGLAEPAPCPGSACAPTGPVSWFSSDGQRALGLHPPGLQQSAQQLCEQHREHGKHQYCPGQGEGPAAGRARATAPSSGYRGAACSLVLAPAHRPGEKGHRGSDPGHTWVPLGRPVKVNVLSGPGMDRGGTDGETHVGIHHHSPAGHSGPPGQTPSISVDHKSQGVHLLPKLLLDP